MAGSITIGKGASPSYYTRQSSPGTDYYAAGAGQEKPGSEPAGVWTGDGCADLGLKSGAEVDHDAFGYICGSHVDPRDGSRIGRAMSHRDAAAIYGGMLAAEPSATAQRKDELMIRDVFGEQINHAAARLGQGDETLCGESRRSGSGS